MWDKKKIALLGLAAVVPLVAWACSGDDNAASPNVDGGTTSSSTSSSTSVADAGDSGGLPPCSDAGTLYSRLGGHAGIRGAVDLVVAAELMDPEIASYFFWQMTPTPGHPNADQVAECFTDLLANAAGGPEMYPPEGGVTDDAGTWMCRSDMMAIHAPLLISGGTFDAFIQIAATTLQGTGMVSSCDLALIGAALTSFKSAIVTVDAGKQAFPGDAAALVGDAAIGDAGGQ